MSSAVVLPPAPSERSLASRRPPIRTEARGWLARVAHPAAGGPIPLWEMGFALCGLLLSIDAGPRILRIGIGVLTGQAGALESTSIKDNPTFVDPVQGDQMTQVLWVGVYLASLWLLCTRRRRPLFDALRAVLPWALVLLAIVSFFWSEVPMLTARRAGGLLFTSLFGMYLATRYSLHGLLRLLLLLTAITMALDLAVVAALPSIGISTEHLVEGWQGVHSHKNSLGHLAAFSAVIWIVFCLDRQPLHRRLLGLVVLAVCLTLLIFSQSKGALATFVLLLALLPLSALARAPLAIGLPAMVALVIAAGLAVPLVLGNLDVVLGLLNRDASLTGRQELWDSVWSAIQRRPLLGYGYGAFWSGGDGPSADVWADLPGWDPKPLTAHNGLLQLGLDLGAVGLVIFAMSFLVNVWLAVECASRDRRMESAASAVLLAFLLISSLPEGVLVTQNSFLWVIYMAISIHLAAGVPGVAQPLRPALTRCRPSPMRATDRAGLKLQAGMETMRMRAGA